VNSCAGSVVSQTATTLTAHLGEEGQSILTLAAEHRSRSREGTGSVSPDQLPIVIELVREYMLDCAGRSF
jgi:hypothetical protein